MERCLPGASTTLDDEDDVDVGADDVVDDDDDVGGGLLLASMVCCQTHTMGGYPCTVRTWNWSMESIVHKNIYICVCC